VSKVATSEVCGMFNVSSTKVVGDISNIETDFWICDKYFKIILALFLPQPIWRRACLPA
jgi:hypothetical protein